MYKGKYRIYGKYLDRQTCANIVDPEEKPQNVASHQGPPCLSLAQQF